MSRGQFGSYAESDSGRSSRGSTWQERRQEGREDREYEQEEGQSSLEEGLFQTYRTMYHALGCNHFDKRDEELERLHRLVRDLELEARGRCWKRDHKEREEGSVSIRGRYGARSHRSGSQ